MNKDRYKKYLESDEWKDKKRLSIKRDNGTCQGCLTATALEVHHLTYERIGDELLTDLVSLCSFCHNQIHGKTKPNGRWRSYLVGETDIIPINYNDMTELEKKRYIGGMG